MVFSFFPQDAPSEALVRFDMEMRSVNWEENAWASEWQSSETLGGSLGTRSAPRARRKEAEAPALGQYREASAGEVSGWGFPDFPVR